MDFRDLLYAASLTPLPTELYPDWSRLHVLDQGEQGACTGFALAAVIDYLRGAQGLPGQVSPDMLFAMAKRYDQWPGEDYNHSSTRGAMKGWYKHGAAPVEAWPAEHAQGLTPGIERLAQEVPLGAYFRVLARINDVQAALRDVGILLASAATHHGWEEPRDGVIRWDDAEPPGDGHAFALVGYTREGFLIQNSWGPDWGGLPIDEQRRPGIALWRYADFEANVWDVWVAQLGVPVAHRVSDTASRYVAAGSGVRLGSAGPRPESISLHYLHIDDGIFDPIGEYASSPAQLDTILHHLQLHRPRHLVLNAHGGLNKVDQAAMRAFKWRRAFADNGVHELHFIWETGLMEELSDLLRSKRQATDERVGSASSWKDNLLEQLAQPLGHALWQEMKRGAERAFHPEAAGSQTLRRLIAWLTALGSEAPRVHIVGHSAGAVWNAHLLRTWRELNGPPVDNLMLLAPACSLELHRQAILPLLGGLVRKQHLFLLTDEDERDDHVARIYGKSLLYLVSNALDDKRRLVPLLGMARFHRAPQPPDSQLFLAGRDSLWSRSTSHGGFDNDLHTMNGLLALMLGTNDFRRFKAEEMQGY
jgi:hypothetical protein